MKAYHVTWEIDIWAENQVEAAKEALGIQRDPSSSATVFTVQEKDTDEQVEIDLDEV